MQNKVLLVYQLFRKSLEVKLAKRYCKKELPISKTIYFKADPLEGLSESFNEKDKILQYINKNRTSDIGNLDCPLASLGKINP